MKSVIAVGVSVLNPITSSMPASLGSAMGSVRIDSQQGHHHLYSLLLLLEPFLHSTYGSNQRLRPFEVAAAALLGEGQDFIRTRARTQVIP